MQIGHLAFSVKDLNKTLDFYCNRLGFPEVFRINGDDGSPWLVYVKVAEKQFLEFFPRDNVNPATDQNSYQHLCFHVDDIHDEVSRLQNNGVTIDTPPSKGKDNNYQAWITDPDGNRIELMQLTAEALQLRG